jgi:hypothetical protein
VVTDDDLYDGYKVCVAGEHLVTSTSVMRQIKKIRIFLLYTITRSLDLNLNFDFDFDFPSMVLGPTFILYSTVAAA